MRASGATPGTASRTTCAACASGGSAALGSRTVSMMYVLNRRPAGSISQKSSKRTVTVRGSAVKQPIFHTSRQRRPKSANSPRSAAATRKASLFSAVFAFTKSLNASCAGNVTPPPKKGGGSGPRAKGTVSNAARSTSRPSPSSSFSGGGSQPIRASRRSPGRSK